MRSHRSCGGVDQLSAGQCQGCTLSEERRSVRGRTGTPACEVGKHRGVALGRSVSGVGAVSWPGRSEARANRSEAQLMRSGARSSRRRAKSGPVSLLPLWGGERGRTRSASDHVWGNNSDWYRCLHLQAQRTVTLMIEYVLSVVHWDGIPLTAKRREH